MRILHISETVMAYAPARFVDLINKYTEHTAKLIQLKDFYIRNPLNIPKITDVGGIIHALDQADVLHFHCCHWFNRRKIKTEDNKQIGIEKYLKKPFLLEYHGSPMREQYKSYQKGFPVMVSTPEMLPLFPKSFFFPCLIDETDTNFYIARNSKIRQLEKNFEDNKIKVCHHYSHHKRLKNTYEFMETKKEIEADEENSQKFKLDLIGQVPINAALDIRSNYDAVFDHLQGYYGLVSIEGMAQGLAVINRCGLREINGMASDSMQELDKFFGSKPPFYIVKDNLTDTIKSLDWQTVEEYGNLGMEYMKNVWSGQKNIHRLIKIYEKL